ncbi:MAG: LD-carboxypeptidase [Alphaproteobacteria bacterium]|nr:LD-carboxypeptidase [Alphaproteobacteria bacterium]
MQKLIPSPLQSGDEIRIIAPSTGIKIIRADCRQIAKQRFEAMGLKVSFGQNTIDDNFDMLGSSEIEKRASDINDAFKDKNIKAIFTIIGGFNSNQVLPFLDYDLIKNNPKIICGFSDITALLNGIYAQTGLIGFYGPHYSSIGMLKGCEYTIDYLQQILFSRSANIVPSNEWSDDLWFLDQEKREFIKNDGWWIINDGIAKGELAGGNLSTYILLQGTPYRPQFSKDTILMIEECNYSLADDKEFLRQLQSIAQRTDFSNIKALLIGRFQKNSGISREKLEFILKNIPQLKGLPIIANIDFGHTTPIATLPIGGNCEVTSQQIKVNW